VGGVRGAWNAKAGKAGGALDRRVHFFRVCSGAPHPSSLGEGKKEHRRANPRAQANNWGSIALTYSDNLLQQQGGRDHCFPLVPAEAGAQSFRERVWPWVPACAGTSGRESATSPR